MTLMIRFDKISKAGHLAQICRWCLGRQITSDIRQAEVIGSSLPVKAVEKSCAYCADAYAERNEIIEKAISKMNDFEYGSFQVGVSISKDYIEREDELRSKLKLNKGIGIKKALTALFKDELQRRTFKKVDNEKWDLLVKIDINSKSVSVQSSPMLFYARYVKLEEGIRTKEQDLSLINKDQDIYPSSSLNESVEGAIREEFIKSLEADDVKIIWSGTEDQQTVVEGNGRPVYVKVLNPKKRYAGFLNLEMRKGRSIQFPLIQVTSASSFQFKSLRKLVLFRIESNPSLESTKAKMLNSLRNIEICERSKKKVLYWVRPISSQGNKLDLLSLMDNGMNPYRVLFGDECAFKGLLNLLGLNRDTKVKQYVVGFYEQT